MILFLTGIIIVNHFGNIKFLKERNDFFNRNYIKDEIIVILSGNFMF